jgi:hypothetical protein
MPVSTAKKSGDPILVRRKAGAIAAIEADWQFVRFEPDSGNLVAEKEGKRIVCSRDECEALNFPGSSEIWELLCSEPDDENLQEAGRAWAELDLPKTASCLLEYGRGLDPSLASCQTSADFTDKARSLASSCENAHAVLRMDMKRAEAEYNRCPVGTAFENDQKDDLLDRWRELQARYATKAHCLDKLVPVCSRLADCLKALQTANHKS